MTSQEAFEDYARRCDYSITRSVVQGLVTYLDNRTEDAWMFWQASERYSRPAIQAAYMRGIKENASLILAQTLQLKKSSAAIRAMLTHFGMDEDEFTKPTFDQARAALGHPAESRDATHE